MPTYIFPEQKKTINKMIKSIQMMKKRVLKIIILFRCVMSDVTVCHIPTQQQPDKLQIDIERTEIESKTVESFNSSLSFLFKCRLNQSKKRRAIFSFSFLYWLTVERCIQYIEFLELAMNAWDHAVCCRYGKACTSGL